jgi:hypothetical protein
VSRGARLVVDLTVRFLPSWVRDRYASEFHAELAELRYAAQWAHALGLLLTAFPLRLTVLRAQAVAAGYPAPRLLCLLGTHSWRRAWNGDGETYVRCRRCGLDGPQQPAGPADWISAPYKMPPQ